MCPERNNLSGPVKAAPGSCSWQGKALVRRGRGVAVQSGNSQSLSGEIRGRAAISNPMCLQRKHCLECSTCLNGCVMSECACDVSEFVYKLLHNQYQLWNRKRTNNCAKVGLSCSLISRTHALSQGKRPSQELCKSTL